MNGLLPYVILTHMFQCTLVRNAAGTGFDSKQNSCLEFAYTEEATFGNVTLFSASSLFTSDTTPFWIALCTEVWRTLSPLFASLQLGIWQLFLCFIGFASSVCLCESGASIALYSDTPNISTIAVCISSLVPSTEYPFLLVTCSTKCKGRASPV